MYLLGTIISLLLFYFNEKSVRRKRSPVGVLQFTGHPGAEHKGLLPERIRFSPPAFAAKITK